jgi:hypothetical protein
MAAPTLTSPSTPECKAPPDPKAELATARHSQNHIQARHDFLLDDDTEAEDDTKSLGSCSLVSLKQRLRNYLNVTAQQLLLCQCFSTPPVAKLALRASLPPSLLLLTSDTHNLPRSTFLELVSARGKQTIQWKPLDRYFCDNLLVYNTYRYPRSFRLLFCTGNPGPSHSNILSTRRL